MQRGRIPPGLQSRPLQLNEHLTNATSVVPPPAGPAVCRPLNLLHLLNLSFTISYPQTPPLWCQRRGYYMDKELAEGQKKIRGSRMRKVRTSQCRFWCLPRLSLWRWVFLYFINDLHARLCLRVCIITDDTIAYLVSNILNS